MPLSDPVPGRAQAPGLARAAKAGFVWQAAAFLLARVSMLLSTVILARILGPADYGLVALGLAIVLALNVVSDIGASQAVVYLPRSTKTRDAALGLALAGSATLALLWVAVAPLVAQWLGNPGSTLLLQVLGAVLVLTSIGQVPDAMLRKDLRFSRRLPGELTRGILRGVVAIVLALAGFGAWSLVWAEVLGAFGYAVVAWLMLGERPGPLRQWFDPAEIRALLRFGGRAAANGGLATSISNVDYLVVSGVLGATSMGLYLVGFRIPELLILSIFQVLSQVTYPVYTRIKDDPERLRRAVLLSIRVQTTYGFSAGAAIAVTAHVAVPLLFGDAYGQTVPVMQAIAFFAVFASVSVGAADVYKSVGRPELGVWMGAARLTVLVPTLLLATRWGISGVAVAQAVVALVFVLLTQQVVARLVGFRMRDLAVAILPSVATGAATAAGAWGATALLPATGWWELVAAVGVAASCGGIVLSLTDRHLVKKVLAR